MTEAKWNESGDPFFMLGSMYKASERKLRLFAVGCCRQLWSRLLDPRSRMAVEAAEEFADGMIDRERLYAARDGARDAVGAFGPAAAVAAQVAAKKASGAAWGTASYSSDESGDGWVMRRREQCNLLRCIFGNPFCPPTLETSLLTPTVILLAKACYDEGRFERLPILADALEECGVSDSELLAHCRSGGPHARGCHVLDLVLGKS